VAAARGHEATHITWMGLGGATDWNLMPRIVAEDFTFVTNNARDFRKLYAAAPVHAGLIIIVPQVPPEMQRQLFDLLLDAVEPGDALVNEAIEIELIDGEAVVTRYDLSGGD
jgi:hypothetical protein